MEKKSGYHLSRGKGKLYEDTEVVATKNIIRHHFNKYLTSIILYLAAYVKIVISLVKNTR